MNDKKSGITRKKVILTAGRILLYLLLAAGILLVARNLINKIFLFSYQRGNYSEFPEKVLVPVELGENYVAPYNVGNIEYQKGDYEAAVQYYYTALQKNPPEDKECSIRINLALAYLHTYPFETMDMENQEEVEAALQVLYTARYFLTENGCASEEFGTADGHSETAEALKKDIDEMIMKLSASQSGGGSDESDGGGGGGEDSDDQSDKDQQKGSSGGEKSEEQQKQESLKEQLKEQKQDLEEGNYGGSHSSDYQYVEGDGEVSGFGEGTPW